jgi:hypothetical protein
MRTCRTVLSFMLLPALVLGLFALAGPLSAQPKRLTPALGNERPATPEAQDLEPALFWPLPEGLFLFQGTGPEVPVEVQVLIDGDLSFSESFQMEVPRELEGHAVELLTSHPKELGVLRALAARGRVTITVRIVIDGVEWDTLPFDQLADLSSELQQGKLQLVNLHFDGSSEPVTPLAQRAVSREACEDYCWDRYLNCLEIECAPQIICDTCEVEYQFCLDECPAPPPPPPPPPCEDPKSVTYHTVTSLVGYGPTGYWQCFEDIWENDFYDGTYYEEWQFVYKDTRYKRVELCDGTVTETVDSVTYWYFYCNLPNYLFCYYPWTWAYNVC